jgi:hypothetical protein
LQHYPVLPDIAFATTANFRIDSEPVPNTVRPIFHFKRQTMIPAEEFEREFVPTRDGPGMYVAAYLVAPAYLAAHIRCLGLSITITSSAGAVNVSLMPLSTTKPGPLVTSTCFL